MENIILKIEEKEKNNLNKQLEKEKNSYKVTYTLTEKNKVITLTEKTRQFFCDNGVNLEKVYFSYNTTPSVYNALDAIIQKNKDIFSIVNK